MPQMMPINWIILFMFFFIMFLFFNIMNFYIFNQKIHPNNFNKIPKMKNFIWKW